MNWFKRMLGICAALPALGMPAHADVLELAMPNGLMGRADFRQGDKGKPGVLLLHGFLQTHDFPTIHRLADTLNNKGYTVLAPTLSLNIPSRRQSLACEAIHTHTVDGDSRELDVWAKWLAGKQPGGVVLTGHSTGSMQLLAYLTGAPDASVKGLVAISIVESQQPLNAQQRSQLLADLRKRIASSNRNPVVQPLSYCRKFNAVPASLLSYLEWSPERILKRTDSTSLPVTYIMGSKDDRLGKNWIERLKSTRAKVRIIEGANHFMDGEYEFDLGDTVLQELEKF